MYNCEKMSLENCMLGNIVMSSQVFLKCLQVPVYWNTGILEESILRLVFQI